VKIVVDSGLCSGHARCNAVAPELYELDSNGYCSIGELDVPAALEHQAREGAAACPERAISIIE
jgi:ferredoxin